MVCSYLWRHGGTCDGTTMLQHDNPHSHVGTRELKYRDSQLRYKADSWWDENKINIFPFCIYLSFAHKLDGDGISWDIKTANN